VETLAAAAQSPRWLSPLQSPRPLSSPSPVRLLSFLLVLLLPISLRRCFVLGSPSRKAAPGSAATARAFSSPAAPAPPLLHAPSRPPSRRGSRATSNRRSSGRGLAHPDSGGSRETQVRAPPCSMPGHLRHVQLAVVRPGSASSAGHIVYGPLLLRGLISLYLFVCVCV
jgi:hypothetical protein